MKATCIFISFYLILSSSLLLAETKLVINSRNTPPTSTIFQKIVTEAFQKHGIIVNFQFLPLARALTNVNSGLDDGDGPRIAGLAQKYSNLRQVPEVVSNLEIIAFTKKLKFVPLGWDSLAPFDVAFIRGTKLLERNVKKYNSLTTVSDIKSLFQLLKKDRIEVVLANRLSGLNMANSLGIEGVKALEPPLFERGLFLYLHKKHQKWVPVITKTLRQMKQNGIYTEIVDSIKKAPQS